MRMCSRDVRRVASRRRPRCDPVQLRRARLCRRRRSWLRMGPGRPRPTTGGCRSIEQRDDQAGADEQSAGPQHGERDHVRECAALATSPGHRSTVLATPRLSAARRRIQPGSRPRSAREHQQHGNAAVTSGSSVAWLWSAACSAPPGHDLL